MPNLTPAVILEEFLRFREAPIKDTANFRWSHAKLCEEFNRQLNALGDSFIKYHHINYVVQRPREEGVDILLRSSLGGSSEEARVGIQMKSYQELDTKDNDLAQRLKAGLTTPATITAWSA